MVSVKTQKSRKRIFTDDNIFDAINRILIIFFSFLVVYPLMYVIFASVSSGVAVEGGLVTFFPVQPTLAAYRQIFEDSIFWRSYANQIYLTTVGSTFSIIISLMGAYALSKKYMPGVRFFTLMLVFTMWFSAGMIPTYLNLQSLNLLNYAGLIFGFGLGAFAVIILRSAFISLPSELQEAAKIDGANEFQNFIFVAIPCIKPSIATVWLLYGISRWNGWFWAMIIVRVEEWIPLQVYLRTMIVIRQHILEGGDFFLAEHSPVTLIYAIIVSSIIPIFIVFPFMQKVFTRGIMEGGLKG